MDERDDAARVLQQPLVINVVGRRSYLFYFISVFYLLCSTVVVRGLGEAPYVAFQVSRHCMMKVLVGISEE